MDIREHGIRLDAPFQLRNVWLLQKQKSIEKTAILIIA
jgi:hypothetical protein